MKNDDNIWNDDAEAKANRPWAGCGIVALGVAALALALALMELLK
jgi:hypothetical protein